MNTAKRVAKYNDQDRANEAFLLIMELALKNPHIDVNQFIGACFSVWTERFYKSGFSYEVFKQQTLLAIDNAKAWWEDEGHES